MNVISRGIRNAFRNVVRTFSLVVILGLSIGLSLTMLIAHQAVSDKISSVKSAIGNTVTIAPAGFSGFSQANNALTTDQLRKVSSVPHVTGVTETLTDRLTTIGSASIPFGRSSDGNSNDNNSTSLTSPVTLNTNGSGSSGGPRFFIAGGGSLPANFSLPVSIMGTNTPLNPNGSNTLTIKSGKTIDGNAANKDALVSSNMASKNNLKVGSTFTAYGQTLTVSGIFTTNTQAGDNNVIVSLPTEQQLSGQSGDVTSATATVDSLDNLSSATTAIKNSLGSSADVTSSEEQADEAVQPLNSVKSISLYSLIGAVIAGAVIILLTMIMIVRERRREIGVIKAIGASNLKVMLQFMIESVTLTIMAAVVGITLGVVAGNPITHILVTSSSSTATAGAPGGGPGGRVVTFGGGGGFRTGGRGLGLVRNNISNIHAAIGWSILLDGLAAAIIIALIGSSLASFFIAKIRPAEVMRVE